MERGPDGLLDEPRPGAPRSIGDEQVEAVIVKTLEQKPADATHWSTRAMARKMAISQSSVSRIWRAFGLQPQRAESFRLSTDPLFVDKVRDVVGLYLHPPERAAVPCVDEKSQIQALARFQPILPMLTGTPERRSHDYVRHGTTSLFAGLDTPTGKVIGAPTGVTGDRVSEVSRADPWRGAGRARGPPHPRQLRHPQDARDQALAAAPPSVRAPLHAHRRVRLNLVERWFAELTKENQARGSHSVPSLECESAAGSLP